jgi:hypothetical protein
MANEFLFMYGSVGKAFIESNQSMQKWLGKLNAELTKDSYAYSMWQFCQWAKKTPDQLIAERLAEDETIAADESKGIKAKKATKGYRSLELVHQFLKQGVVHSKRTYATGTIKEKTINVGQLSKARRVTLYAALRSFYKLNRVDSESTALPEDDDFRIKEVHSDNKAVDVKATYIPLAQAKAAIATCKAPYRELFSCMMYGGLGRREVLLINAMWPKLKEQLKAVKDPEQPIKLSYKFRKSNEEQEYFTFIPAKLLTPFIGQEFCWMVPVQGGKGKKIPMQGYHYQQPWKRAARVAGVKEYSRPHFFRDLLITDGLADAEIPETFVNFMTGHVVDPNHYLQLSKKPEKVLEQWLKWKAYVEAEDPTLHKEVKEQSEEIAELKARLQQQAEQIEYEKRRGDAFEKFITETDRLKEEHGGKEFEITVKDEETGEIAKRKGILGRSSKRGGSFNK